jgi:hypothetical protein
MKTKRVGLYNSVRSRGWLFAVLLVLLFSTACQGLPIKIELPWINTPKPIEEPESPLDAVGTPTPVSPEPEPTLTAETAAEKLIIWLPPELSPHEESLAGFLLQEKLNNFAHENKIEIVVRVKSQIGSGSLTDSLTATNLAAPTLLPDLIVLSATDLQLAAKRDLIYPHPRLQELMNDTDWYPIGQEVSLVNGQVLGIPLLTNPLTLVYNEVSLLVPSNDWTAIKDNFGYFGFAADDSQAKYLLMLYISVGGKVIDPQGRAILEEGPLVEALTALKEGQSALHISNLTVGFQTEDQVWNAFLNRSLDTAIVPVGTILNRGEPVNNQPKPALTEPELTLGSAMAWALGNPDPIRQELAMKLLAELTETEFLSSWSEALGWLPARPSALGAWKEPNLKPSLEKIAQAARLYPPEEIVNRLGPALRNATLLILRDGADPIETAKTTIESIK